MPVLSREIDFAQSLLLYMLDKTWLDSAGASFTPQGIELRDAILQSRYIGTEYASVVSDYVDDVPNVFDTFKTVPNLPPGTSQFMHTTEGITVMPFDTVLRDIYNKVGVSNLAKGKYGDKPYRNLVKKLGYMYYSGSTNNAISRAFNRGSVFLLLFPKLAFKSAVDEATVLANVSSPSMVFDLLYGKGRQLSNINLAITADNSMQGPVKELFLNLVGKNPAKFKSALERKQLTGMKEREVEFVDPDTGEIITQKELVTAEEFFGMDPQEMLVREAVDRYGSKLSPQERQWVIDDYLLTGDNVSDAMIGSVIGSTYGDSMALGTKMAKELYAKSPLTEALDDAGLKVLSKPYVDKLNQLNDAEKAFAHYSYFYKLFSKNQKYGINMAELFFQNRALKEQRDVDNFVQYGMSYFGWNKDKPKPSLAKKINDDFGQVSILRNAGISEEEISKIIILSMAKEMRYVFHGGTGYNEKLFKLLEDKVWKAKEKARKTEYFAEKRQVEREMAGVPEVLSGEELKRRSDYLKKSIKYSTAVGQLTKEEFIEATEGFRLKGKIKTDIGFKAIKALDPNQPGGLDKIMTKGWEWMDRSLNDLNRSDVFRLKVLEERGKLQADEEMMVNYLVEQGATRENAVVQAAGWMANQARHTAADTMLKYVDNPNLKSQLAFNLRVVGRFVRATEDFAKRTIRWMLRHPESIPYRMGHVSHAADGTGILYDDQDGNKYVVIPNDGVFWQNIMPALVMVMNPVYAIPQAGKAIKDKNWGFFKQAEWNQYTMKVSFLNPSYSEDAGLYTFTGANMALPIIGLRQLLVGAGERLEKPDVYNFGLSLDNILLGGISDDTNVFRSLVPAPLTNFFKSLVGDYKDTQGIIAAYQAISYLQYNEKTAKTPDDFLNKEGVYDPSKAQEFLDEWRIQTANVLAQKAAFNSISGAPIQIGAPNIAKHLREAGLVTFTKEYGDILRAVLQFNQENGFPLGDPYTTAVSLHAAERPGKLIFQVPKNLKETKVAINYTQKTLSWAIANKDFLTKFGSAGWVFAPNIGEYDPKVMKYLEAANLIPPDNNPFDWNNELLKNYIESTAVAKEMSLYYAYDREVERLLNDPNNPNRNFVTYRDEVKSKADAKKQALLDSNPLLKNVFGSRDFQSLEKLRSNFNELRTIVTEDKFPKGVTLETKNLLKTMVRSASELLIVNESSIVAGQYMGNTELDTQVAKMYDQYEKIARQNGTLAEAWGAIIKPLLDKSYNVPFRIVRKPGD
jgi:hypothetical protein